MPANSEPTPPSSTSSTNGASPDAQQYRVVRKRNRVPLSCAPCRHRKLKCNRGHPCNNCTKRGDNASCNYATPKSRKTPGTTNSANQSPDDMQNRIDRLEGLVLSLMTSGGQPGSTAAAQAAISSSRSDSISTTSDMRFEVEHTTETIREERTDGEDDSEVERVSKGIGVMKVDGNKSMYASDNHWYAILAEINEVKQYFSSHKEEYMRHAAKVKAATSSENMGSSFLFSGAFVRDKNELLAAFPSKADSDRLIARYFNAYDPSVHIIHGPTFQKQYDLHWQDTNATSVAWLGLCFAMMTLALQSYNTAGDEPPEYQGKSVALAHEYRRMTAQCLILADMTQPIPIILETLVLHIQAEYGRSRDAEPCVLLMAGIAIRLAMRMGYHRDPAPHSLITPFQGEMRRRIWSFVRKMDLLISFQFGMPAIVRSDQTDTQLPRNIYDDELHPDMKSLPPSRSSFQVTPMTYMIAKSRMTYVFGRVVERVQSISDQPSYEETMSLDRELRETRATHPALLQMRSFSENAKDPANLIMQRIGLELIFLRSLFVLHRRFIARGRDNPRFAYSRRTCIDASMEMLAHQATLHEEAQPRGRLRSVKWYISSLTTHDFLLAAGLVCLDLYHVTEAERRANRKNSSQPQSPMSTDLYAEDRKQAMIQAVERCIAIWESIKEASMEAYKASAMLRILIQKIKAACAQQASHSNSSLGGTQQTTYPTKSPQFGFFPNGQVAGFSSKEDDLAPEQSAAMTLGMLSSGGLSPSPGFGLSNGQMSAASSAERQSYPASMAGLLNEPAQGERTGFTPGYTGPDANTAMTGASSPFSQLFGANSGFGSLEGLDANIDWGAWDSYIEGNANMMDPAAQMWPTNLDVPPMDGVQNTQSSNQQSAQTGTGNGVFMGAGTPAASGLM